MRKSMTILLRERLAEPRTLRMPGAFNAMSARIIADGGYPVMSLSEYSVAASLLGTAARGLVTLDEMAATARYITAAVQTPLLVDAGRGHGNAINAMRTVKMFIQAGAAGMHMGDHDGLGEAIPVEEAAGKIAACVHVRDELDPDFLIIARLDGQGGDEQTVETMVRRAKAYVAAGADLIYPRGPSGDDEIAQMGRSVAAPLVLDRGEGARLPALGMAILSHGDQALQRSAGAMWDYLQGFAAEDVDYVLRFLDQVKQHPTDNMHEFVGFPAIRELEERFLPKEDLVNRYENSLGYKP
jgi:2-methylisocitrate lyase-like PEP mutase family enzyme